MGIRSTVTTEMGRTGATGVDDDAAHALTEMATAGHWVTPWTQYGFEPATELIGEGIQRAQGSLSEVIGAAALQQRRTLGRPLLGRVPAETFQFLGESLTQLKGIDVDWFVERFQKIYHHSGRFLVQRFKKFLEKKTKQTNYLETNPSKILTNCVKNPLKKTSVIPDRLFWPF